MKNHILLDGDTCQITSRIREIDEGYFIAYNLKEKRFEVHNRTQHPDTLCLCLPYLQLDERTINLVRKTRKENADRLIEQMDRENELVRQRALNSAAEQIKEVLNEN